MDACNHGAIAVNDDLIICDEYHEASCSIRAVFAVVPLNVSELAQRSIARFATGVQTKWDVRAFSLHGVNMEDAVCRVFEWLTDRSATEARALATTLQHYGHVFQVVDAVTAPTDEKSPSRHVVVTQVADAGITLPGMDYVNDSGQRLAIHKGVLTELYSDVFFTCNGTCISLMPPTGAEVEAYSSVDMFFADV